MQIKKASGHNHNYLMTKRFPLYSLFAVLLAVAVVGCNSDSDNIVTEGDFGNCSVSSFNLTRNDKVLNRLDSVYFSIDLVNAVIFNADSLPKGTKIDKLVLKIGTSSASGCDLTFRKLGTPRDTTVNYLSSPNDSINFSDGPVKLLVTSYDGLSKREYTVKVNVHQVQPDTLFWDNAAKRTLPGPYVDPEKQKTVEFQGKAYCMTVSGQSTSLSVCRNPFDGDWDIAEVTLPANADVNSFTSSSDSFYILDSDGNLYKSEDGMTWISTGARIDHIYGGYNGVILGARKDSDGWTHVTYPASEERAVPAGCPIGGTSQLFVYRSEWSAEPLAMFVGGRDASGMVVGSAWGYDGNRWGKISTRDIDEREGITMFPYFTPRVDTNSWRITERSALIAMGGRYESAEGVVVSKNVYVSYDQGITWDEASSYLQLPEYIPAFCGAQALVFNSEMSVDGETAQSSWLPSSGSHLPVWANPEPLVLSRVSKPENSWECPYIYMFGGEDASGRLHNSVWRGVIRRFSFRPLY